MELGTTISMVVVYTVHADGLVPWNIECLLYPMLNKFYLILKYFYINVYVR